MDAIRKASLEKECQALRADLKSWEHRWSSEHDGAKPSREAIKGTPDIAKKYKEYNRLRDVLSGKVSDESPPKRKAPEPAQTPVKRTRYYKTAPDAATDPPPFSILSTPSADRTAPSPAPPTSIGPTPHRDGKVLGLFAFLDENAQTTPSRKAAAATADVQTPQRTAGREREDPEEFRLGRTPKSGSKRRHADTATVTPLKSADGNAQRVLPRTPVSVSKLQFGTPSFLRRRPLPAVEEADEYASPEKLRRTSRRPFARGLSAIVANLRRVEETQFDDDEEAMREMEGDVPPEGFSDKPAAVPAPVPVPVLEDGQATAAVDAAADAAVIAPESQPAMRLLGGFDDEGAHDDAVEETQMDRGREMRVYKKKNPKRTTRRVNMKPTFIRRSAGEVEDAFLEDDEDGEEEDDGAAVPETQVDPTTAADGAGSDGEEEYRVGGAATKQVPPPAKARKRKGAAGEGKVEEEGTVRKVAKKVNELAHANFRRLKLRGKGAGGGPGVGSRFRRRR